MAPLTSICAPSRSVRLPALTPPARRSPASANRPGSRPCRRSPPAPATGRGGTGRSCPALAGGQAGGHQGVALAVQRGGAVQVHQDGGGRAGTQRHRAVGADAVQMDGAARVHRGGRGQHAGLLTSARRVMSPSGDRIRPRLRTVPTPEAVTSLPRVVEATLPLGALAALHHEIVAGRQRRAAPGRGDGAGIVDPRPQQQDASRRTGSRSKDGWSR